MAVAVRSLPAKYAPLGVEFTNIMFRTVPSLFQMARALPRKRRRCDLRGRLLQANVWSILTVAPQF